MINLSNNHASENCAARPSGIPWSLIIEALFLVYAIAILIHLGKGPYIRTSQPFTGHFIEISET